MLSALTAGPPHFLPIWQHLFHNYELAAAQKLQYMHNTLGGDAKRFFLDRVHGTAATFAQAIDMVSTEYNSSIRQDRVKNYISGLRLSSLVKDETDNSGALEETYKTITKLAPQVPRSHHGESYMVEFLRNTVVRSPWASKPLSRMATHPLPLLQLYGELEAALHLRSEARVAGMRGKVAHRAVTPGGEVPSILFAGKGRYVRRDRDVGKRLSAVKTSSGAEDDEVHIFEAMMDGSEALREQDR